MIVNAMLEKEPGNPKIHRLRVIHLYEADDNLILSIKWRKLLHHACDNGFINASNFGSQLFNKWSMPPISVTKLIKII